ncbi:DUF3261 domain-containing protein [Thaumasiovibrio sp. DFM-14]|uniref:DUF3261 domain-containing protein n=1 Tax=Thaumasiovibrio sp. DFM-14 TaxID=3384792 RepID=UPI0039A00C8A
MRISRICRYVQLLRIVISSMLLIGCSTSSTVHQTRPSHSLPTPASLGYALNAQQLMTVDVGDKAQRIVMALEVDQQQLVLAGFSSFGLPLFQISWDGITLNNTLHIEGIDGLPDAKQVLLDIMLVLWPRESLQTWLNDTATTMTENKAARQIERNGEVMLEIRYRHHTDVDGVIDVYRPEVEMGYQLTTIFWEKS